MKKLLMLLGAVLIFSACTTEEYYIDETQMNRIIKDFQVLSGDWNHPTSPSANEYRFTYTFPFPELTSFLYNNGTIVAYFEYEDGGRKYQQALPVVWPRQNVNDPNDTWTEVINYDYSAGQITFTVTNDDFNYSNFNGSDPGTMLFRVVILW